MPNIPGTGSTAEDSRPIDQLLDGYALVEPSICKHNNSNTG